MALKSEEVVVILREELTRAQGFDSDELSTNRESALDAYLNRPLGNEKEGRSTIQSSDVADMVEAVTASINPILTRDTLVRFEPVDEDDQEQAELESQFVSYMTDLASNQFLEITSAVKDALLCRNGWLKVYIDEEKRVETVKQTEKAEFQIQAQLDESGKDITWTVTSLDENEHGSFDVTFKKTTHKRELVVESIAPEDMLYSPEHNSPSLEGLRFLAERKMLTRTELIEMGYSKKVVAELPTRDVDSKNDSRARRTDESNRNAAADASQESVETWVIHTWIDIDGSGAALLWHIHLAEQTILMKELADWIPYATGSPVLMPHRLYGLSIYDKLEQLQLTKTAFLRMWVDNGNSVNNARIVFNPKETETNDVADATPGSGIRSKNPTNVVQLQTSDMGASISAALGYLDKVRSERTGASLDLGAAEMQLAGHNIGQQGAERQISLREQLASQMTATLANTLLKTTFMLVHQTIRKFLPGTMTANLQGKWQSANPSEWPERKHVHVATGLSIGEKSQMISALTQVISAQQGMLQAGMEGELVNKGNLYNSLLDWCRAANIDAPEQYWVDPDSDEAQQAMQSKQQQQQQADAKQFEQMNAQQQQQFLVFYMQQFIDKYKADQSTKFDYDKAALDSELAEAKIVGDATLDLERQQLHFDNQAAGAARAAEATPVPGGDNGQG